MQNNKDSKKQDQNRKRKDDELKVKEALDKKDPKLYFIACNETGIVPQDQDMYEQRHPPQSGAFAPRVLGRCGGRLGTG